MTIRVHSPFQINEQLQSQIDQKVGKLQRLFERIKAAEVHFKNHVEDNQTDPDKIVELKVYMMRRVLLASEHSKDLEEALMRVVEKMRKQLKAYEQEVNIV